MTLLDGQNLIRSREPPNNLICNRLCACLPKRALPNERYPPALLPQASHVPLISCNRLAELVLPEFRSRRWCGRVSTSLVSMPETALNQDHSSSTGQDNVRRSRQLPVVQAKPQTASMKRTPEGYFRLGIFPPDAGHHPGASCWINDISQSYPLT
jgi:hypothetical protein